MSNLVSALCNVCGTVRTLDLLRGRHSPGRWMARRRCRTCKTATEHAGLYPEERRAAWQQIDDDRVAREAAARAAFEHAAEQLRDLGVLVEVVAHLGSPGGVAQYLDDGRFLVVVHEALPGSQRLAVLDFARYAILTHRERLWRVNRGSDTDVPVAMLHIDFPQPG